VTVRPFCKLVTRTTVLKGSERYAAVSSFGEKDSPLAVFPPLYDIVGAAPVAPAVVASAPPVAIPAVQGAYTTPFIYRYVYEPDRILVIDPSTGIAVQAIPR